jgi:hypothetical protein
MQNSNVKNVREYLKGTKFFIKEHRNNFLSSGSIISISYKVDKTKRMNQLLIFNECDFTVEELKIRIDDALATNDPQYRNFHQEYYELNQALTPLWRSLTIEEVLED